MADEFKSIRENLFKALSGRTFGDKDEGDEGEAGASGSDASAAKALIGALFARAGKGKDEVVNTMAREIGMAVAAMLKEPLAQLAKNQKLQISFEFVPKEAPDPAAGKVAAKAPAEPQSKPVAPQGVSRPAVKAKEKAGGKSRKKVPRAANYEDDD